jgi:cell wall-associated NlpC family hydrolase
MLSKEQKEENKMNKKILLLLAGITLTFSMYNSVSFANNANSYTTLHEGMKNVQVKQLQKDLSNLGYFKSTATGYYGYITKTSIKKFQKDNGLYPDAVAGPATMKKIKITKLTKTAKNYLGVPYVWGGTTYKGFDCSGFTQKVFKVNGKSISRIASHQFKDGVRVSRSNIKPGDMVFFTTYKPGPSHVGIYLGNNNFIHASSGKGKVTISNLNKNYYSTRFIGAKRIFV